MYRISQLNVILANKKISQRKTRFYNEILLYTLFRSISIIYNDQWFGGGDFNSVPKKALVCA